jgi:carnitine O-acetyltransferase
MKHTRVDGSCIHRLSEFICNGLSKDLIHHGSHPIRHVAPPQEITFTTNKKILDAISEAERKFDAYTQAHNMTVLLYPSMGKKFIKKYKISPDSLIQMILQLAYFKMFGTIRSTYETTMTRKFQHGRTEVCYVASKDVVAFVKTMENDKATREEKLFALQSAIKTQINLMTDAKNGNGINRHLICLKGLLKPEEQAPLLFRDHAYSYLKHFHVASSQVTSPYFECYGYAEITQDGVGGPYMIHSDSLQFCVSSFKTITIDGKVYSDATFKFKSFLKMACDDVYNLLIQEVTDLAKL